FGPDKKGGGDSNVKEDGPCSHVRRKHRDVAWHVRVQGRVAPRPRSPPEARLAARAADRAQPALPSGPRLRPHQVTARSVVALPNIVRSLRTPPGRTNKPDGDIVSCRLNPGPERPRQGGIYMTA